MNAALGFAEHSGVPLGAPVYDAAGESLGTLVAADAYALVIARGFFFPKEFTVAMAAVDRFEDGKLYLSLTKGQLTGSPDGSG
jgi:hypothetical protein